MEKNPRYGASFDRNFIEFTGQTRFADGFLVHALIAAKLAPDELMYALCWIESGNQAFDFTDADQRDKRGQKYEARDIRKLFRYTQREAREFSERTGDYGPWEFRDPSRMSPCQGAAASTQSD